MTEARALTPLLDNDEFTYGLQFFHKGYEMVIAQWFDWEGNSYQIDLRYVKPDGTAKNLVSALDAEGTRWYAVVHTSDTNLDKIPGIKDDMELWLSRAQKVLDLHPVAGDSVVSPTDFPFDGTGTEKIIWMVENGFEYASGKLSIDAPAENF